MEENLVRQSYAALRAYARSYMRDLEAMDISADLQELTRCPVGLVSAGVKSILDIGRCAYDFLCTV